MPPKVVEKKLTKKELKEKQLEEQRQREEQERIRKEEEEKKRLEQERLRKLEEERLAAEEKARLQEEEIENEVQKSVFRENLENAKKVAKAQDDWEKFTLCSTKPDTQSEAQITTFITLFKEQKAIQDLKVSEELEKLQYAENVVRDIYRYIYQIKSERKPSQQIQQGMDAIIRNKQYIKAIRDIQLDRLEQINTHIIINTDSILEEKQAEQSKKIQEQSKNQSKLDDKNKQEIFKVYPPVDDLRYGILIYPTSKPSTYKYKPNDFQEIQITVEAPRQITMYIQKVIYTSFDYLSKDEYSKDRVLGGILDVEYLQLLPQPKKVNNWTLKASYDPQESVKRYLFDITNNPIKVSYQLPPYIWIAEDHKWRAAIFDKQQEQWMQLDEEPKLEKGAITISVNKLGPVALLQERFKDFPYKQFDLRCVSNDTGRFDIVTPRDTFKFLIGPGWITLLNKNPEFQFFSNRKLPIGALFYELYRCGVNLMPIEQDAYAANIIRKDELAEELAIMDLSEAVRGFYIQSSRWNSHSGPQIVAKIKENPEFDEKFEENQEKDWKTLQWWQNKCAAIQARDSHKQFNSHYLHDTETHCNLETLLKFHQLTSADIIQKMKDLHYVIFIETVQQVLRLTKVLAFTIKE